MGVIADKIRKAIFGGEVRDNIADGIEVVEQLREDYDNQVINAGNSNAEIVDARGGQAKLKDRLDKFDSDLDTITPYVLNYVNIKSLGAKGDGINDDTDIIEYALTTYKYIYCPMGIYLITRPLTMKLGSMILGDNPQFTVFLCRNPKGTYAITYGEEYNYNGYRGKIRGIRFKSDSESTEKPFGLYLNSGIIIEDVDFYTMGKSIDRVDKYIDMIKLDRVYIGYCVPNGEYLLKISGNADAIKIDQLKFEPWDGDKTEYNGILIDRSHGGNIKNSIINCNIRIVRSNGFSIENTHMETLTRQLQIVDSNITLKDFFKWKNTNTNDIIISTTDYKFNNIINLENVTFYTTGTNYDNFDYAVSEIGEIPNNCQINLLNVVRQFNLIDKNNASMFTMGINIDNLDKFNLNSSQLSVNGTIYPKKVIKANIENEELKKATNFGTITTTSDITWKGESGALVYRYIGVVDEIRKVMSFYSNQSSSVSVTKGGNGVTIANSGGHTKQSGFVLLVRGSETNQYNKAAKLPLNCGCRLLDNGISVNLFKWEDITESAVYNDYNQASKFFTINNGTNAVVYMTAPPTKGVWSSGDRCINTNIASGQIKAWTYNGTEWISEGVY